MEGSDKKEGIVFRLSPQQIEYYQSNHDINVACGSIRSGKTYTQIFKLFMFLRSEECVPKENILLVGKTGGTIEKNIITDFLNLAERFGALGEFHYVKAPDKRIDYLPKKLSIHCVGGNDEGSEGKIRGMTTQALFGDEITLLPKSFIDQCFGRMSAGAQKAFFTTNPDSPAHWFYRDYIQNPDIDCKVHYFTLIDNPSLSTKYKNRVKALYKGAMYDRFILGKWVADKEHMIIPEFIDNEEKVVQEMAMPKYCHKLVAMDVGFRDLTFLVFGYYDFEKAIAVIQDEIAVKAPLTSELHDKIRQKEKELWGIEHLGEYKYKDDIQPYARFSDTDLLLINDLSITYRLTFNATQKDNKDAQINILRRMIDQGRVKINPRCERLCSHLRTGVWNLNHTSYGRTDEEGHFDGIDALLYLVRNLPLHSSPFPKGYIDIQSNFIDNDTYRQQSKDEDVLVEALGL